ncbi:preprotein translocase subunit SecA [Halomonas sp. GFAJ-1]|uniref:preprotein translocase subunit SecA n=1 Tax=Halomonas sp. GFAJ-1 TaxID=1118153 RepID=UPI00023A469A|nr:preprotein translocase subunit SecA [Halomonas sp. GFAJ-1]AVI62950.1 preprotein translocase subunit SecA [Halomonas sp. GFAJ-1]EHK61986.1 preprotein translocase subunit SecA [Halomonas sp. GFAJ-1]
MLFALNRYPVNGVDRPEKVVQPPSWLDQLWAWITAHVHLPSVLSLFALKTLLPFIHYYGKKLHRLSDGALDQYIHDQRQQLLKTGVNIINVVRNFALIREVARRELHMPHRDVQLLGGMSLMRGCMTEMQTGEGKTLTATLAAATAAMAGIPVHVVTVNDYLSKRDAELMLPIYDRLGLNVHAVVHDMSSAERRQAYRADITYCTSKELVFDYLRDMKRFENVRSPLQAHAANLQSRLSTRLLLLRGLHFAIVDEADSVLLDEARTPLILSTEDDGNHDLGLPLIHASLEMTEEFKKGEHFDIEKGVLFLTVKGKEVLSDKIAVQRRARQLHLIEKAKLEWLAHQALVAKHQIIKDRHYLVRDGKILIIDEHNGRVLSDRRWAKGLQQLLEVLEGCERTPPNVTIAQITFQRFFRRYHHLSGMTGTAKEVKKELWQTYGRPFLPVPPHQKNRRQKGNIYNFKDNHSRWEWIAQQALEKSSQGRPVLITTVNVNDSEELSALLVDSIPHHDVLNARQDNNEADVIARAGYSGSVTIATSIAGRGTDIKLDDAAKALGGLHIIAAGLHDAGRIDRQIEGRCARQGDPGSIEWAISEEDAILDELQGWHKHVGGLYKRQKKAQRLREKRHAHQRARMLRADWKSSERLGFSGRLE